MRWRRGMVLRHPKLFQHCPQPNCHKLGTPLSARSQRGKWASSLKTSSCELLQRAGKFWHRLWRPIMIPSRPFETSCIALQAATSSIRPLISSRYLLDTMGSYSLLPESFWKHVMFWSPQCLRDAVQLQCLWLQKWNPGFVGTCASHAELPTLCYKHEKTTSMQVFSHANADGVSAAC